MHHCGPGVNYLLACQASLTHDVKELMGMNISGQAAQTAPICLSDAEYARQAISGLRQVLSGAATHFEMEYPCHTPSSSRWFVMTAHPLYHPKGANGLRGVVLSHIDVTAWRTLHGNSGDTAT
jgi:two-component system CheB/CheR fusion protein